MTRSFTLLSNLLKNLPIHVLQHWRNVFKRFVVGWNWTTIWNVSAIIKSFSIIYYNWWLADNPSSQARNLGVILDSTMTFKPHISNIVRVSSFHIRNIGQIRKYLNKSAAEQIIHAFVTSRLDNKNALLYGLPQNQIVFSTYKTQQLVL